MPVYSRKQLRQDLGRYYLRDTIVSTTTSSQPSGNQCLVDSVQADPAFSGESLHARAWLRVGGIDRRVASFNTGSGAFVWVQPGSAQGSGSEYEVHSMLSPADKDAALNLAIMALPIRREYPLAAASAQHFYSLGTDILQVWRARYFADPAHSLDRQSRNFSWWAVVDTPTGRELRIVPALTGTEQIVLDALVRATLGSADAATVNLPEDRWALYGAESHCWSFLIKQGSSREIKQYERSALRAAAKFREITSRHIAMSKEVEFDDPV